MDNNVYIYGLVEPKTNTLRYVGKTTDLDRRLRRHINE
jgi:predicted GIY-YIG superfamily endonuclease